MRFQIHTLAALAVLGTGFITGCTDRQVIGYDTEPWRYRTPRKMTFKPITGHKLEMLALSANKSFPAGKPAEISFRIVNRGSAPVRVPEWMLNTNDNVKVYYRPFQDTPVKAPFYTADGWNCEQTAATDTAQRFQLVLNPGNSVFISRRLIFVRSLTKPAAPQKYQIVGVVNLSSLDLKSPVFSITVE